MKQEGVAMKSPRLIQIVSVVCGLLMYGTVRGQAPPAGPQRTGSGFDLFGYWTAVMHEDALERGAGPETADYGGLSINEAARLFALSYNASRVTRRHHQCDGYVAPYQVRALHFRDETKKVNVLLQNHMLMDPIQEKLDKLAARKRGEPNPFVVGAPEYQKFLGVMEGCTRVNIARRKL
jgi:hypothetical protein